MFQDFEGFPTSLYGESLSTADLERIYEWVNLGDETQDLVAEYLDATGYDLQSVEMADVREKLFCVLDDPWTPDKETAMGRYVLADGLLDVPDHLRGYIDEQALGRDWLMNFSVSTNGYVLGD
jgi:antirestriction protein